MKINNNTTIEQHIINYSLKISTPNIDVLGLYSLWKVSWIWKRI